MELAKENLARYKAKKENKIIKWIAENQIFSAVIVFTVLFSTINIILLTNFFKLLSNF